MICTLLWFISFIVRKMSAQEERTCLIVKPDGVQRGLIGKIIKKFEQKGYKLVAMKFIMPSEEMIKNHYSHLSTESYYPGLVSYMSSGPVVPMVWEGLNIIKNANIIIGITQPEECIPGTIRGDLSIQTGPNLVHGSYDLERAKREINIWFTEKELISWKPAITTWVHEA